MRSEATAGPAVRLAGVGKRYTLDPEHPWGVRDILRPRRMLSQVRAKRGFWALTDVSLDVPHGQILGIIGPNGSGKSSLLRILAGISPPTTGSVEINGAYGALLELGSGFHPAVTGRDNAYLNALFMGMSKDEARTALPAIIEFSELGDFIDQPMRTYSSGMYLRLGFSVAIHMRPDILLVDEVLAVGDAQFQEKCFDHFRSLRRQGITVIIVTHNVDTLIGFADRVIMLEKGCVKHDGPPARIVSTYINTLRTESPLMEGAYRRALMGRIAEQMVADGTGDEIERRLAERMREVGS